MALGVAEAAAGERQTTGTATCNDCAMLPPGTLLTVALQDLCVTLRPSLVNVTVMTEITSRVSLNSPTRFTRACSRVPERDATERSPWALTTGQGIVDACRTLPSAVPATRSGG